MRDTREVVVRTVDRYGCPAVILFDPEEDERKLPMSRPLKLHIVEQARALIAGTGVVAILPET